MWLTAGGWRGEEGRFMFLGDFGWGKWERMVGGGAYALVALLVGPLELGGGVPDIAFGLALSVAL